MRKIIATTFISLDGVMQAPGGPEGIIVGLAEELSSKSVAEVLGNP
jgi:hypothetical protein